MPAIALYNAYARRAFALLAGVCAVSVFCYGLFLLEAVGHTAERAKAQSAIVSLKSKLSALESTYLAQTGSLNLALAQSLGFVAPKSVTTVYATDGSRTLTLGGTGAGPQ